MSTPAVTNWFGDLVSHPKFVVEATSTDELIAILKDPVQYPSPVRAVGPDHSRARCRLGGKENTHERFSA